MKQYLRGQGSAYIALLDANNNPGAFRKLGNCSEIELSASVERLEHRESETGDGNVDLVQHSSIGAKAKVKIDEISPENLAFAMAGAINTILAGTVSSLPVGSAVDKEGDIIALKHQSLSSVVLTDSTGSPVTLTPGTHYKLQPDYGQYEILDLTGITLPLNIDYAYAENVSVNLASVLPVAVALRVAGLNKAKGSAKFLVEVHRWLIEPSTAVKIISSDLAEAAVEGDMLYDETKAADPVLGQVARMIQMK